MFLQQIQSAKEMRKKRILYLIVKYTFLFTAMGAIKKHVNQTCNIHSEVLHMFQTAKDICGM